MDKWNNTSYSDFEFKTLFDAYLISSAYLTIPRIQSSLCIQNEKKSNNLMYI